VNHYDLVTIIIPMFNCSEFIQQCLKSVVEQTYGNFEVILVDDCSTDNTPNICQSLIENDKRFSLICAQENGGPGQSRNLGIDAAKGSYLLFLDADDWLTNDALSVLVDAQKESQADLVVSAFDKLQPGQKTIRVSHFKENRTIATEQISAYALDYMRQPGKYMMFSYCWGRLFKASIINDNNLRLIPEQRICEDVHFNFEYISYAKKLHYVDTSTYNYRFGNPNSAGMASFLKGKKPILFFADVWTAYHRILTFVEEFGSHEERVEVQKVTRLGHISHVIVLLIRACGGPLGKPLKALVKQMLQDSTFRKNLPYYSPLKGQSRMVPFLMRVGLVLPLILMCRYKYKKRYGQIPKQAS